MITCSGCDARWTGLATAHCCAEGCHKTFTSYASFDRHRAGSHSKGRFCLDPSTATVDNPDSPKHGEKIFRLTTRPYECWTTAEKLPEFWND